VACCHRRDVKARSSRSRIVNCMGEALKFCPRNVDADFVSRRLDNERGFTLIELLVVILIIGILAAIAIPAFLNQSSKASDSAAKTQVGTLQTAIKTYAIDNSGSYVGATLVKLQEIEPTLKDKSTAVAKEVVSPTATGFTVESEAVGTKNIYKIVSAAGEVKRECAAAGKGGCRAAGTW
jgi:type IV pilus assembly protein PilA